MDEAGVAGRPRGEIVGEDRHRAPEHDDPPALVVRRDQQPAVEGALETGEQALEPLGGLEVPAIEDEAACPRVREEADVGIRGVGPRQAEHQPAADQLLEGHRAHR